MDRIIGMEASLAEGATERERDDAWERKDELTPRDATLVLKSILQRISIEANNAAAAAKPLAELAKSNRDGYRALALFTQADVLLQKDDLKGAAAKLGAIAADTSLAKPFRDLALVRQTSAEFDTLKPQVVVERLRPLAVPGGPWLGSAGEMVAISYLRMNQRQQAGTLFGQIARDTGVPETIRQRAVQMAGVLGVDAVASAGASTGATARVITPAASNEDTKAQ